MKEEIKDILKWISQIVKQYGFMIMLALSIWTGIKIVWFWIVLPILGIVAFKQFVPVDISILSLITGWIFIFSLLKKLGNIIFK